MNTVLDTNVIISAAISQRGNPAKILETMSDNEEIQLFLGEEIFIESNGVLSRPRLIISSETQAPFPKGSYTFGRIKRKFPCISLT